MGVSEPLRIDAEFLHVSGEFVSLQGALAGLLPLSRVHNISSVFIDWSPSANRWKLAVMIYQPTETAP
jgi:hypothetical protein